MKLLNHESETKNKNLHNSDFFAAAPKTHAVRKPRSLGRFSKELPEVAFKSNSYKDYYELSPDSSGTPYNSRR